MLALLFTYHFNPELLALACGDPLAWLSNGGMALASGGLYVDSKTLEDIATGFKGFTLSDDARKKEIEQLKDDQDRLQNDFRKYQKAVLGKWGGAKSAPGPNEVVSPECAEYLSAVLIQCGLAQGKLSGHKHLTQLVEFSQKTLSLAQQQRSGMTDSEMKTALGSSDIPLPVGYGKEIVELVWKYGQFRNYATVYPLGASPTKLPKLKTSPQFGVIGQSAAITEKSPQAEYVTFTPFKSGGLIRIPSEIDADTLGVLGQFLARYIAREAAKWEDTVGFLGDGTSTYGSVSGVGKKADTLGRKVQLAASKTSPSDITLADFRFLRSKVDGAALMNAAYYMHISMESHLVTFNESIGVMPYLANGLLGSRLDGFPIRWVGVLPVFDTGANPSAYPVMFGDLSYWYLGERLNWDVQTSRDVFFSTDEIAMRALGRMDIQCMADAAMGVLQTAAS